MYPLDEPSDRDLFEASPFPAVVSRLRDDVIVAINAMAAEMASKPAAQLVGRRITDFYRDPAERAVLVERLRKDGRADDVLLRVGHSDEPTRWARVASRLISFEGESAVLSVFSDVTDQVAAEQALRGSEQRLGEQSEALTALTAHQASTPGFYERLAKLLQTTAQTLRAERVSLWRFVDNRGAILCIDLFQLTSGLHESGLELPRDLAPAYFDALERDRVIAADDAHHDPRTSEFAADYLTRHGIGAMLDVPLRQRDTTIGVLCVEHVGNARIWTTDERNFTISVANLVTVALVDEERESAVRRLAESEARARLVLDTAPDAFVGINTDGRIVSWNRQAVATFGYSTEEAIGRLLSETIIPPSFRQAHRDGMRRFLATGQATVVNQRLELTAIDRTGREFPVEITITSPIRLDNGHFFGAFLRDISDRRRHEEELRHAKEAAEAATRAKSEFLANMSHELRTPLNGVLGYAQLLQRDANLVPTQREAIDAISVCGAHLLDLINDVLDLSRIEAGRVDYEPESTDLRQLAVDLEQMLANPVRSKGLHLSTRIAADVPANVIVDRRHLRQVLFNLLGNAVKFTTSGDVTLTVEPVAAGQLEFAVTDTGPGIAQEDFGQIFEAFGQTRAGMAAGGTGLGLTISARLVRVMGGALGVASEVGRGSRFAFSLPLTPAEKTSDRADGELAELPADARLAPGVHASALVADDNPMNRRVLTRLLESAGFRVWSASGGHEAVEMTIRHRPDVVLMDRRMGDLDGFEAVRRIHANAATATTPVLAVTSSVFGDTREEARQAGCVDFIPKPIRAELLFSRLRHHLGLQFISPRRWSEPEAHETVRRQPTGDGAARLGERLRAAASLGDITALEQLASELSAPDSPRPDLAERIASLTHRFEFDALVGVATALDDDQVAYVGS
jgi:PAS domain S-box-containing protein